MSEKSIFPERRKNFLTDVGEGGITAICKPLPSEVGTKSKVVDDVEKKKRIRSVQIFVYDASGGFVAERYWDNETPVEKFSLIDLDSMVEIGLLDGNTPYDFFFLANLPELSVTMDEIPLDGKPMRRTTGSNRTDIFFITSMREETGCILPWKGSS